MAAPVKADDGQIRGRGDNTRSPPLGGHIAADERQSVAFQLGEGLLAGAFGQPLRAAQVDGHPERLEQRGRRGELGPRVLLRREPRRVLQDHRPQPAGFVQRE